MFGIFKWFFGIVMLILVTYLIILAWQAISGTVSTTVEEVPQTVTSTNTTGSTTNATIDWLRNFFRPVTYAPGVVVAGSDTTNESTSRNPIADKLLNYYKDWNVGIVNGPDDFDERWGSTVHFTDSLKNNPNPNTNTNTYNTGGVNGNVENIKLNLKQNSIIKNNQIITGLADVTSFVDNVFYLTILDSSKNEIGVSKMFMNGSISPSGTVPFRGVVMFKTPRTSSGYLKIKNDNQNLVKIYFDKIPTLNMPKILLSSLEKNKCVVTGCSMQFCVEGSEAKKLISTCEYRPAYQCYRTAICERDAVTAKCGWKMTSELASCLQYSF